CLLRRRRKPLAYGLVLRRLGIVHWSVMLCRAYRRFSQCWRRLLFSSKSFWKKVGLPLCLGSDECGTNGIYRIVGLYIWRLHVSTYQLGTIWIRLFCRAYRHPTDRHQYHGVETRHGDTKVPNYA